MFKFVVFLALFAIAAARPWTSGAGLVYTSDLPTSGYEYTHTVQAPDYVNHVSVSAPLGGLGGLAKTYSLPVGQTLYIAPLAYHAW